MLWEHKLMSQLCQVLETFKPVSVDICIGLFSKTFSWFIHHWTE